MYFQGLGSGFQPSPGCRPGQRNLVTGSSVLDTLQLDMAHLVCGQSSCHHEGAQSASGPASLASSQPSSSHTKTSSDVHLTAPKVSLGASRNVLASKQTMALRRQGPGPAATSTPSHLTHSSDYFDPSLWREERIRAFSNLMDRFHLPPVSNENDTSSNRAILVTRVGKIPDTSMNANRDCSSSPPQQPPPGTYSQVGTAETSLFSWTPPLLSSVPHAQRELGASRQEHDIGLGNQPEKEEQKQRKDNR